MSAFFDTCPSCGQRYWHCFVGTTMVSGHECPNGSEAAFEARQAAMAEKMEEQEQAFRDWRRRVAAT